MRHLRNLLTLTGLLALVVMILPVTPVPWRWIGAMAQPGENTPGAPDLIVMMGGGGIPSSSGLMRSWKTAEAATRYPSARVLVAMPLEENETLPGLIERELMMRGVAPQRMAREPKGRNTREQAVECMVLTGGAPLTVALVTCPEHMTRTWRAFEKAGFTKLQALPAWAEPIQAALEYDGRELGGRALGGRIGGSAMIKYRYWDNLIILVKCTRETAAMVYYWMMGWV